MLNLLEVEVGARVRLTTGEVVEVVENPADGQWLLVDRDGSPELVHAQEIAGLEE